MLKTLASITIIFFALAGLCAIGIGTYWFFNQKAKKRQLDILRKRLEELAPADPEYNDVRALYVSLLIDEKSCSSSSLGIAVSHNQDVTQHSNHYPDSTGLSSYDSSVCSDGGHHS